MGEGRILSSDEQAEQALETLRRHGRNRGDSFDIGGFEESGNPNDMITSLMSNPQQLIGSLNLTEKQAENIKSLIVGGGTGGIHKLLNRYLGDEVASALGGLISGYIAKRLVGK